MVVVEADRHAVPVAVDDELVEGPPRRLGGRPLGRDGLSIAAVFRYRSGLPFTPGFRNGVDANGDGSWSNDPAVVDTDLDGMTEILGAWDCLAPYRGQIVERNACRDPGLSTLNVRLGLGPVHLGGYPLELWAEFLNVTDADFSVRDHALLLVDPAGAIVTDPVSGVSTIPLLVNENFGEKTAYRGGGRMMRFGLRVNY